MLLLDVVNLAFGALFALLLGMQADLWTVLMFVVVYVCFVIAKNRMRKRTTEAPDMRKTPEHEGIGEEI